jgi:hypothetical protein
MARPPLARSLGELYRLFLRQQASRWRLAGLATLGLLAVALAAVTRSADDPAEAGTSLVAELGIGLTAPVAALWIASAMFAELTEDRLLAYVWLRPIPRWHLAVAAAAATLTVVGPLVVIPTTAAAAVAAAPDLIGSAALSSFLAVLGYSGLFLWAGSRSTRALWWGLLYILVWENGLARLDDGIARLAVRSYPESLLARATNVDLRLDGRAAWAIAVVPPALFALGTWLTSRRLDRHDVD